MKSLTTFIGLAIFGIIAVIIGAAELTTNQFAFIVFAGFLIYACVIVTRDYLNHVYDIRHNRDIDTNFWALIPNFNLNWSGSFSLEFEFLCFAWYIDFVRKEKKEQPFKFNVSNGPFNSIYDLTESIKKFGKMDIRDHVIVPPPESCNPAFDIMVDDPYKITDEEKSKKYLDSLIKENSKLAITITRPNTETNAFNVYLGDKYADHLQFDEMLGLIATLTISDKKPHLQWLRTAKEHQELCRQGNYNK